MKYRALRVVKYVYMGIGAILIVLGLFSLASSIIIILSRQPQELLNFSSLVGLLYILLAGVFIFSIGELIDLLITLATDMHYVADYFRRITRVRRPKE